MCDRESSLLIEHKMDRQLEVRHQSGPVGWLMGSAVELAGFLLLVASFQVTSYACILTEPFFQGCAIFSIDNLDIRNKSGFGLK